MSDTKWRKLLAALDRPELNLGQARLKFVDSDQVHIVNMNAAHLHTPHPFVDIFEFGPTALRSIEWIEFPARAEYPRRSPDGRGRIPSRFVEQDIARAAEIIGRLGRFQTEQGTNFLRIVGRTREAR